LRSLYDDIVETLTNTNFTIPNVSVRESYNEAFKTYPLLVVHEITNRPISHGTVSGEDRTILAYQVDIIVKDCMDAGFYPTVIGRSEAARIMTAEVSDALDALKVTRRTITPGASAPDTVTTIWRGEGVLDSYGYSYRR